ncbi:DUF4265 domain-containing protein [Luteibacter jiangsuensis]|uniref:DUF4265 domain-containing protein n=1 Tax=Luteibacter jiangsuensis TaxID=637577 RepID=A0ABX0Q3Z9_9GAMM|nr:DUF4265 domain-containing protein [Luteibacter jiangsuensis]
MGYGVGFVAVRAPAGAFAAGGVVLKGGVVARSQNSLIRILFHEKEALVRVDEWLKAQGCTTEYSGDFNLLAVSIPERVNLAHIQEYLGSEEASGTVGYEEPILRH